MHYVFLVVSQPPDSPDYALHSFGSKSLNLMVKIAQSSHIVTQVCYMLILQFVLVFD